MRSCNILPLSVTALVMVGCFATNGTATSDNTSSSDDDTDESEDTGTDDDDDDTDTDAEDSGSSTEACSSSDCSDDDSTSTSTSSTGSVDDSTGSSSDDTSTSSTSDTTTSSTTDTTTSSTTSSSDGSGMDTGGDESGDAETSGDETGEPDETCPLPSTFQWTSTGPLAQPKNPDARSLKDFTVARAGDNYIVYGTTADGNWNGFMSTFGSFDEWADVEQHYIPGMVAPTIFYFEPKDVWVLAYQWGFQYATSTTPEDPDSWSRSTSLLSGDPTGGRGTGPIDQTIICDDTDCYLFFNEDAGGVYRASMPIDQFPGTFSNAQRIMEESTSLIFEGIQVYSVKGSDQYLMIIENNGTRAYRAWTADDLGGEWRQLEGANTTSSPFAGEANVTWPDGQWTRDISHGDLVRENPNEKMEIDPCNLQMLYQGRDPNQNVSYIDLPYRPGLLTLQR